MRHAFTLIEMLVVVAIIATLIALLLPTLGLIRQQSRKTETRQIINQVHLAISIYQKVANGLPPVQTGPTGHQSRISGRGEHHPEAVTGDPAQGRLLDLLRTGGGMPTPPGYLSGRDPQGLITLVDAWRNPLIYQLADPRQSGMPDQKAIAGFWLNRTGSAAPDRRFPVVYSGGEAGLRDDEPSIADHYLYLADRAEFVTEDP